MKIFLKNPTQAEVKEAINLALGTKRNSSRINLYAILVSLNYVWMD
ncbi:MAG: hypothetical protein MUE96_03585 [Bacteroidia bacterium]|nr:hypothetical protein [Bacteroidia bacterium]